MSILSLSKRNVNVNVNVNADAVGKVGKNDLDLCGFGRRGGWMDKWKQRDITFFGSWVPILTLPFITRGRFWARFGKVGIVGLG